MNAEANCGNCLWESTDYMRENNGFFEYNDSFGLGINNFNLRFID